MASPGRIPSSPPKGASLQDELRHWKAQYEQVEIELQEFQNSSKELEAELEKDIEESEKRERDLRNKAEALHYEVEEWKSKTLQSKTEATKTQAVLEKEITTLRESNRSMQMKLRDIEVQNDDFERQARHQTSSLEDLESKYNVTIERGVLLEEDVKIGEQEREALRIEAQHLRDELSDLRVELEITQGKLLHAEENLESARSRKVTPIATEALRPPSPFSEASTSATTTTSPSLSTPPPKSETSTIQTSPPSPPLSDASGAAPAKAKALAPITPLPKRTRTLPTTTPRLSGIRPPRHSRGPSIPVATPQPNRTMPKTPRAPPSRLSYAQQPPSTSSRSLHQIRGLIGKMQKLEERVHTARSKLPAPTSTPPRGSPRSASISASAHPSIPATVTVRSARKRTSQSTSSSNTAASASAATTTTDPPRSASRLSFGYNASAGAKLSDTPSRPGSRASVSRNDHQFARPSSRASITGRSTPQPGHRPRSSLSGTYAPAREPPRASTPGPKHAFSRSVSMATDGDSSFVDGRTTPVTARRTTMDRGGTSIPTPKRPSYAMNPAGRRQSGAGAAPGETQEGLGEMRPPSSRGRRLSGVGETF
ncbi:hypothetical protein BT63DRAFT_444262 [Microthyrium microscopicum]|uniref:NUDE domain-containing protein n=1 Tax=Microthyrium microscopicum TaxID=703497 RepID=A0A6A6TYN3_9PEZI|nr:hypothetical protein BT63DRAFT_444262 [Microthyrium microscopicum]